MAACKRSVCLGCVGLTGYGGVGKAQRRVGDELLGFGRAGATKTLSQAEQPLWALGWDPALVSDLGNLPALGHG